MKENIKDYIIEHLTHNNIGDTATSAISGVFTANVMMMIFDINHIINVVFFSFIGGISGLAGKLFLQYLYDKLKKKL